jgi:hypothetical protein
MVVNWEGCGRTCIGLAQGTITALPKIHRRKPQKPLLEYPGQYLKPRPESKARMPTTTSLFSVLTLLTANLIDSTVHT